MKTDDWLLGATKKLEESGIGTTRLDCLVLLEDATGKDRGWLLARPEFELSDAQIERLDRQVRRRVKHEPLAYIRGKTEFYGREFKVNSRVLEPRPESETMIQMLKRLPLPKNPIIFDVGSGSGSLAITAKLELPRAEVTAIDIDPNCRKVTTENARRLKTDIKVTKADLLNPAVIRNAAAGSSIVLANLPYVPDNYTLNDAAMNEPRLAIFGGGDGLDIYRRLFTQFADYGWHPSYVVTEALPFQHSKLTHIAREKGFALLDTDDFIQVFVPS